MNPWRKTIIFTFIVLLPAVVVGISNFHVFPDSALSATIMLLITVGVAGVFTWQSGNATERISRFCVLADIVICAILCVNLGGHWLLAREVSAARQGVEERHAEEDREDRRLRAEAERQIALKKAEVETARAEAERARATAIAINADRRRLKELPLSQRRSQSPVTAPAAQPIAAPSTDPLTPPLPGSATASAASPESKPMLTPEQVLERWWWFLTTLAFAECFMSVLAGAILCGIWEWDRNEVQRPGPLAEQREPQEVAPGAKIAAAAVESSVTVAAVEKQAEIASEPLRIANSPSAPKRRLADDPDKPPRVLPNTYWTRKGRGWTLEFKKKVKQEWLYEYYGLLKFETWDNLKQSYQDDELKDIIKGIIIAKRSELQRARDSRSAAHSLRLVGKR
jgi:hypothetical protein